MARPPEKRFSVRGIEVAVWVREQETERGTRINRSVTMQRRYFDKKTSEWKTTSFFAEGEIGTLAMLLQSAFAYIAQAPKAVSQEKKYGEELPPVEGGEEEIPF